MKKDIIQKYIQKIEFSMKKYQKSVTISLECKSKKEVDIISGSLEPEMKKDIPQTQIEMKKTNNKIILKISADQTNILRAAINSYIRWIETAYKVGEIN